MIKALDRKLFRDLWRLRASAFAIALVISSGVAILIMSLSTHHSLSLTKYKYYQESHFADIFAHCKRAPIYLIERIKDIPGVKRAEPRITAFVNLQIQGFNEPVLGHLLSIPDFTEPTINKPYLRKGRWIQPYRDEEVILSEAFANAHHLSLGDSINAVINGRYKTLNIVGIALSAEHIYQIAPGALFPDYKRYGVLWMARTPFSTAYDLENAFNDLVIELSPEANAQRVMAQIDLLLKPYGGQIAFEQKDQYSNRFLTEELKQLKTMSFLFPVIFFGVAAFLLNIVINRLIATQREQIALLKAFGYSNFKIGLHYLELVSAIVGIGVLLGIGLGSWLGSGLSKLYSDFYRFPYLTYELRALEIVTATIISLGMAAMGSWFAVKNAVRLQPAIAMRPATPTHFKASWFEKFFIESFASTTRMIVRNLIRRPLKALLSIIGIAFACGILMVGNFQKPAIDHMVKIQYGEYQRQDISVTLAEPTSTKVLTSMRGLPGVLYAEGHRVVPIQLKHQNNIYRTSLHGYPQTPVLERPLDLSFSPLSLPPKGVILTDYLGTILDVHAGDMIQMDVLEGHQQSLMVPVIGFNKQYMGLSAFAQLNYVNEIMREGPAINAINLSINSDYKDTLYPKLQEMPKVVGIGVREHMIQSFYDTMGETILIFTFIVSLLGGILSFGIIYNNARITFAERVRELATMRVLGFKRQEITALMLGELWFLTLIAIPVGFVVGYYLCLFLSNNLQSDLYRVPLILPKSSLIQTAWIVIAATIVTSLIIIHNISKLDMIAALKARE